MTSNKEGSRWTKEAIVAVAIALLSMFGAVYDNFSHDDRQMATDISALQQSREDTDSRITHIESQVDKLVDHLVDHPVSSASR